MKSISQFVALAIPVLQIGLGSWLLARRRRFFRAARSVPGTTLEPVVLPSRGADDGESYIIRFEYEVAGVRYVRENPDGFTATHRGARAGRWVMVYYREEAPERGRLIGRAMAFGAVALIVLGLAIGGMFVFIAIRDGGL